MPKSRKKINFPHHRFIETSRRYAVICAGRLAETECEHIDCPGAPGDKSDQLRQKAESAVRDKSFRNMGELFSGVSRWIADEGTGVISHTFCGQQIVGAEEIRGLYRSADLLAQDASEGIIYGGAGLVVPAGARNGCEIIYRTRAVPFRDAGMGSG